jgi:hypothetical protein
MMKNLFQRRWFPALLLCAGILGAGCPCIGNRVVVPDPALQSAIRAELGLPFGCLSESDLLDLTELNANDLNIRNLEGLQFAENLVTLDLSNNDFQSISPLSNLQQLTHLDLSFNRISFIEALQGLRFLETLFLQGNPVGDWAPLRVNAATGGFPVGGLVVVSRDSVEDDNGNLLPGFQQARDALVERGVEVLLDSGTAD